MSKHLVPKLFKQPLILKIFFKFLRKSRKRGSQSQRRGQVRIVTGLAHVVVLVSKLSREAGKEKNGINMWKMLKVK